jgi:polyferredoxin
MGSMDRQRVRNGVLVVSLLLFPVTMNYLSPYIIIDAASQGVINGSFVVFTALFISSLFVGRLWCGWLCPGNGLNNLCGLANHRPAKGGRRDLIKYVTWGLWLAAIAYTVYSAGGYGQLDLFYMTESGISVAEPQNYVMYYVIVGLFVALNLAFGRGAVCHYLCWMAPFMVVGNRIKNAFGYPGLHLEADKGSCIECGACTRGCPMGLEVQDMVQGGEMLQCECIHCGTCIDACPKGVIKWSWR